MPRAKTTAEDIVAWARSFGVGVGDASGDIDTRFCAHEAYHAIELDLPRDSLGWHTDAIHFEISELDEPRIVETEVRARACEWIVCDTLGIAYDVEKWAWISFMESFKNGIGVAIPKNMAKLITEAKASREVQKIAKRILREARGHAKKEVVRVEAPTRQRR